MVLVASDGHFLPHKDLMVLQISAGLGGNHSGKGCVSRVPEAKSRAECSSEAVLREVRVGRPHLVPPTVCSRQAVAHQEEKRPERLGVRSGGASNVGS